MEWLDINSVKNFFFCRQGRTRNSFKLIVFGEEPRVAMIGVHLSEYFEKWRRRTFIHAPRELVPKRINIELFTNEERFTDFIEIRKTITTLSEKNFIMITVVLATGSKSF